MTVLTVRHFHNPPELAVEVEKDKTNVKTEIHLVIQVGDQGSL